MNDSIRADFDRLALLDNDDWNHNNHYHSFLLRAMPQPCEKALDIGSGSGAFSRLLAAHSEHVLGLDLSPEMVKVAQERSRNYPNLDFEVADVLQFDFQPQSYDCISSIATLHHLDLKIILQKAKQILRPGGVLLVLDLYKAESLIDFVMGTAAIPAGLLLRWMKAGRLTEPEAVRKAWEEHGAHDVYQPLSAIRQICSEIIPGARVQRHLLWRYSLIWKKMG